MVDIDINNANKSEFVHDWKDVLIIIDITIVKSNHHKSVWKLSSIDHHIGQIGRGYGCIAPIMERFHLSPKIIHRDKITIPITSIGYMVIKQYRGGDMSGWVPFHIRVVCWKGCISRYGSIGRYR